LHYVGREDPGGRHRDRAARPPSPARAAACPHPGQPQQETRTRPLTRNIKTTGTA